jgi:hypothetical protein
LIEYWKAAGDPGREDNMGAKIADWIKSNQSFVIGFVSGVIFGGILGIIGAWLA